jgi:hypothetical protein
MYQISNSPPESNSCSSPTVNVGRLSTCMNTFVAFGVGASTNPHESNLFPATCRLVIDEDSRGIHAQVVVVWFGTLSPKLWEASPLQPQSNITIKTGVLFSVRTGAGRAAVSRNGLHLRVRRWCVRNLSSSVQIANPYRM